MESKSSGASGIINGKYERIFRFTDTAWIVPFFVSGHGLSPAHSTESKTLDDWIRKAFADGLRNSGVAAGIIFWANKSILSWPELRRP